ncbi:hypothetical protein ACHAWF_005816 [Thalassiosira exigua]
MGRTKMTSRMHTAGAMKLAPPLATKAKPPAKKAKRTSPRHHKSATPAKEASSKASCINNIGTTVIIKSTRKSSAPTEITTEDVQEDRTVGNYTFCKLDMFEPHPFAFSYGLAPDSNDRVFKTYITACSKGVFKYKSRFGRNLPWNDHELLYPHLYGEPFVCKLSEPGVYDSNTGWNESQLEWLTHCVKGRKKRERQHGDITIAMANAITWYCMKVGKEDRGRKVYRLRQLLPFPWGTKALPPGVKYRHGKFTINKKLDKMSNVLAMGFPVWWFVQWMCHTRDDWESGRSVFVAPGRCGIGCPHLITITKKREFPNLTMQEMEEGLRRKTCQWKNIFPAGLQISSSKTTALAKAFGHNYYEMLEKDPILGNDFPNRVHGCHSMCDSTSMLELPEELWAKCKDGYCTVVSAGACQCFAHISAQSKSCNERHKYCPGYVLSDITVEGMIKRTYAKVCNCDQLEGNPGRVSCSNIYFS